MTGYSENSDHTPDPTAMTGTLETSGTGGGAHERLGGNVAAFKDSGQFSREVERIVAEKMDKLREELYAEVAKGMAPTVEENGLQVNQVPVVTGDDTGAPADSEKSADVATEDGEDEAEETESEDEPEEKSSEEPSDYVKKVTEAVENVVKPTARKTTSRRQSTKK